MINIEELESKLKQFNSDIIFRRGENNLSLDVIGRYDRSKDCVDNEWKMGDLAEYLGKKINIINQLTSVPISYYSFGCNQNAATYCVTFNLKPKEENKQVCETCGK
jgi:hypothetical protein